jgi:hypothetical protein
MKILNMQRNESGISILETALSMLVLLPLILGALALYTMMADHRSLDTALERSVFDSRLPLIALGETGTVSLSESRVQIEADRLVDGIREELNLLRAEPLQESEFLIEIYSAVATIDANTGRVQSVTEPILRQMRGALTTDQATLDEFSIADELVVLQSASIASGASTLAVPLSGGTDLGLQYAPAAAILVMRVFVQEQERGLLQYLRAGDRLSLAGRVRANVYSGIRFFEEGQ